MDNEQLREIEQSEGYANYGRLRLFIAFFIMAVGSFFKPQDMNGLLNSAYKFEVIQGILQYEDELFRNSQ